MDEGRRHSSLHLCPLLAQSGHSNNHSPHLEHRPRLTFPFDRKRPQEVIQLQAPRLFAIQDCLDDHGRQQCQTRKPAGIGLIDPFGLGQLCDSRVFASLNQPPPPICSSDSLSQPAQSRQRTTKPKKPGCGNTAGLKLEIQRACCPIAKSAFSLAHPRNVHHRRGVPPNGAQT